MPVYNQPKNLPLPTPHNQGGRLEFWLCLRLGSDCIVRPMQHNLPLVQCSSSLKKMCSHSEGSLVPRPCVFVGCSTKFTQKAWSILSHDECHSLRHDHSTGINDVIDEIAHCLVVKEAPRDHSDASE